MKKLIIYINETFEEEKALVDLATMKTLEKGDYYHDKINQTIDGFIEGLEFAGIMVIEEDYGELSACECVGCC